MSLFKSLKDKRNAKKHNITYQEYLDYLVLNEKYNTKIEEFIIFLKESTSQQFEDYINNYKEVFNIEKYLIYSKCIELGLSDQNSRLYIEKYKNKYKPIRFIDYLAAQELTLTLNQYDEYVSNYKNSISATRYLDLIKANEHHITLLEYDEWFKSYKDSMSIERFSDLLRARAQKMTLEEYDEWISAKNLHMTVEEYRRLQIAQKMNLTLTEYDLYIKLKPIAESCEKKHILNSFDEIKALNLLGFEHIILSKSLKKIPIKAFSGCTSFKQISLPRGVKEIGENAFENCTSLMSMIFPGTIKYIPKNIFSGCSSLESIYLLHGIEKVDITGWADLSNLSEVASTTSISSFIVEDDRIRQSIDGSNESKLNMIRSSVEILEIDEIENVHDFPNLRVLIIDDLYHTKSIKNCPKLEVIIANKFDGKNDMINTKEFIIPKLKFFLIKRFYNNNNNCVRLTKLYKELIWLHVPAETSKISLYSLSKLKIIGVTDYKALPKSVSKGLLYKMKVPEVDPYCYENCKDGRTYISSSKPTNFNLTYERLIINEGATVVEKKAYQNKKMIEVILPYSLQEIQAEAFANCDSLKKVTFSKVVPTTISLYAFLGSDQIEEMNIPEKFEFKHKYNIKKLNISDVKTISLEGISTIPPYYASGSGIKEIIIPVTVHTIDSKAFAGCKDLEKIIFESDLVEIASDAFEHCENVKEIQWGNNQNFKIAGETGFPKIGKMVIPEGVTEIREGTFRNWGLRTIEFPSSLAFIDKEAFAGCKNLKVFNGGRKNTITITNSIRVTKSSFYGCTNLKEIIYDCDEITKESASLIDQCEASTVWIRDDIKVRDFSLLKGKSIENIRCLETLNQVLLSGSLIKSYRFPPNVKRLELPKSVESLSVNNFSGDGEALKEVILSENTFLIEPEFFRYFANIDEISMHVDALKLHGKENIPEKIKLKTFGEESEVTHVYECKGEVCKLPPKMTYREKLFITKLIISQDAVLIAPKAFEGLRYLKSVEIKGAVKEIKESAFANCDYLENISLPYGLEEIGENAFQGCESLLDIEIPESVIKIEKGAFRGCKCIKEVTIPPELKVIKEETFMDCENVEAIYGMRNVEYVEGRAFMNCASLKELVFSNSVKSISNPFERCTKLERIVIPNDLEKFDGQLGTCIALKKIYFPKIIDELSFRSFDPGVWNSDYSKRIIEKSYSPVKIYAYRGSKWKKRVGSTDVIYLNKKEYEDIIEEAFISSRIQTQKQDLDVSFYDHPEETLSIRKGDQLRKSIARGYQRASWRTRSTQSTSSDPFPENSSDMTSLLDSLKKNQSSEYECIKVEPSEIKNITDDISEINADSLNIAEVITNRIFTVAFDSEVLGDREYCFVSLISENGGYASQIMRVEMQEGNFNGQIEVQLELNNGINEGEFLVLVTANDKDTILCSKRIEVDVAFVMDIGFGF